MISVFERMTSFEYIDACVYLMDLHVFNSTITLLNCNVSFWVRRYAPLNISSSISSPERAGPRRLVGTFSRFNPSSHKLNHVLSFGVYTLNSMMMLFIDQYIHSRILGLAAVAL